jgi:acetolactate synthase-1/2/3 large subunit
LSNPQTEGAHQVSALPARCGGHIVADALAIQGVDTVFGVPGESYLPVLDGLYRHPGIRFIVCRQEGGAAFMAEAYAKFTGRPGVLMVTRGPGATNAAIGIHTAQQDSTPMVVLVGQVGTSMTDREAFQEIDYRRMFGSMVKWVAQVDQITRLPEYLAHAFQVAASGRMGPVVLALPEDVLEASAQVPDTLASTPTQAWPNPEQVASLIAAIHASERPVLLVGGSGWSAHAVMQLRQFSEYHRIPVCCAFRFQDLFHNNHPHYIGDVGIGINPALFARLRASDLILAIGPRLGEMTTGGYSLFDVPVPTLPIAHIHPGSEELGRVYQTRWMINAGMPQAMDALMQASTAPPGAALAERRRIAVCEARAAYERWQEQPPAAAEAASRGCIDPWQVVQTLRQCVPADSVITNGAGNFATWAHRFWRYSGLRSQLAPTSGAMGYGLPAALAAAICDSQRSVVCFSGDGDFLMTGQELATAMQYRLGFVVLVFNNNMYGTIRMHQEREYPARVYGTMLTNPNFAHYARSFGAWGQVAEDAASLREVLEEACQVARHEQRPAVIELRIDPQTITPQLTLDRLRRSDRN